jgi:hypothetical protein
MPEEDQIELTVAMRGATNRLQQLLKEKAGLELSDQQTVAQALFFAMNWCADIPAPLALALAMQQAKQLDDADDVFNHMGLNAL